MEAHRELKQVVAERRIQSESAEPLTCTVPSKHPLQQSGMAPEHSLPGHYCNPDRLQLLSWKKGIFTSPCSFTQPFYI